MSDPDKCEKVVFYSENKPVGNPIPPPPCGEEQQKLPKELVEPTGELETYTPAPLPRPITLYSLPITARCEIDVIDTTSYPGKAFPSEGVPVYLAAGDRYDVISIQSVAGIDQSILTYIAKNKLEDEIEAELKSRTLTAQSLAKLTGLPPSKAATFMQLASAVHARLDSTARAIAISLLECIWWNDAQTATCEKDMGMVGVATSSEHPSAVASAVVPDRMVSSDVGKGVADSIAHGQAVSALECFYISDPVEVDCVTRPDRPEEFTEWVVTDPEGVEPRRVGYYALPEGHVVSYVSKDEANSVALQMALAELNCFYINKHIDMQCEDPDARNLNVDPEWPGSEPVGVYLGTTTSEFESGYNWAVGPDVRIPAQRVIVPERYIISTISTTDANNQAVQLAESLLACCYINDRIFIECPEEANRDYSPTWSYEVPRGTFVSCKSKKDANDQAWASAEGIVDCIYCNDVVLPQCVPNWVVDAVTTGIMLSRTIEMNGAVYPEGSVFKLPLPLNVEGLVNPYTGELVNVADWSMDATIGVAKDTVCSTSKREVDEIVELLPAVVTEPKTGVPACRFKSTRLLAGCSFVDPYNPDDKQDGAWHGSASGTSTSTTLYEPAPITYYGTDADGKRYRAYKAKPTRSLSTKLSQPTPGEYIDFPEGLFVATAADVPEYKDRVNDLTLDEAEQIVKNYLDGLVLELAKSVIECRYANPRTVVDCAYKNYTPSYSGRRRSGDITGDGYSGYDDPVALSNNGWKFGWRKPTQNLAPGSTHPSTRDGKLTVIEAGTIQSSKYQDVLQQTKALAESLLYCKYINDPRSCATSCSGGTEGAHIVVSSGDSKKVEAGTIIADSVEEANRLADEMVKCAPAVCLYGNDSITATCTCRDESSSTVHYGTATVPENMFVSSNAHQVQFAAHAHATELCNIDCVPIPKLYYSAKLEIQCIDESASCSMPKSKDSGVTIGGGVALKRSGPQTITVPEGMFVSEKEESVSAEAIRMFAQQLCTGVWTNADAVQYTTCVSVVSFLYKPGKTGDGHSTTDYGAWATYNTYNCIEETYTLTAGSVAADTPQGVCDTIYAIASTGINSTSRAASIAASRWLAGQYKEDGGSDMKSGCGEVCAIKYVTGQEPLIDEGIIKVNYANQSTDGSTYGGVVKTVKASSSAMGYLIDNGVITIPYANKAAEGSGGASIYGVIGDVQEATDATAVPTLVNGVLKLPKGGGGNITDIKYDDTIAKPEISSGMIKLSVADSGGEGDGQLGGMKGVSVAPSLTAPKITKGVLEIPLASSASSDGHGLVSQILNEGEELKINDGTIYIPDANMASSRAGLVSKIEAASDTNWDISAGTIKVALAKKAEVAGLLKDVEMSESATDVTLDAGKLTIPIGTYKFDEIWLKTSKSGKITNVRFAEEKANTVATELANQAKAQVDAATITVTGSTTVMASTTDAGGAVGDIVATANITGTVGSPGGSVSYDHVHS